MSIIKSFGEFWNPDAVDWEDKKLMGEWRTKKGERRTNNFWNAKGIYVLYADFKPIYVGKALADQSGVGKRLSDHLSDRLLARWDMFSWYSLSQPGVTKLGMTKTGGRHLTVEEMVDTLEAITILITDPPLNRKRESFKDAYEVQQVGGSVRTIRSYLQEIADKL